MVHLNEKKLIELFGKNANDSKHLDLSGRGIESIDQNTFKNCRNLTDLRLDGNKLKSISPKTFENLTKLTRLDLDNNQLQSIDSKTFENLIKLEFLFLFYNNDLFLNGKFKSPIIFSSCKSLKYLAISQPKKTFTNW